MLKVHLNVFKQAKEMITTEVKLAFPDFSKIFHLYTDASNIQLGATLVSDGKPLRFYTRKLHKSQLGYYMGNKELLVIVERLKAFSEAIWGQNLTVHADYLNLLYSKLPNQQMTKRKLLLKDYNPKVVHISGGGNNAANALSRLDLTDKVDDDRVLGWEI